VLLVFVALSLFSSVLSRPWLETTSPKWPILCQSCFRRACKYEFFAILLIWPTSNLILIMFLLGFSPYSNSHQKR